MEKLGQFGKDHFAPHKNNQFNSGGKKLVITKNDESDEDIDETYSQESASNESNFIRKQPDRSRGKHPLNSDSDEETNQLMKMYEQK
jgi:hypothetical protein